MGSITSRPASNISIGLTTDDLGLGSTEINSAKNDSAIEADRPGQLVTSTAANVGSILYVQTDNMAGQGTEDEPLLATITARSHMSIQANLPAGYDLHAGAIYLSDEDADLNKEGLGVRAFAIDTYGTAATNSNFGKRYINPAFSGNGYQMEGSKEISGGFDVTDFNDFAADNDVPPKNSPPHVDEDVTFDFNDTQVAVGADSVRVLLTNIKAGSNKDPFDLAIDLTINLVGGTSILKTYDYLSDDTGVGGLFNLFPGGTDVIEMDFSATSLGLTATQSVDSFTIGAREDPADPLKGTDEHFLIHGFSADVTDVTDVPEPTTMAMLLLGMLTVVASRRRFRKRRKAKTFHGKHPILSGLTGRGV